MKNTHLILSFLFCFFLTSNIVAQVDENKSGSWYMYLWNTDIKDSPFGLQGDVQYRNWNAIGDLQQLLLRGAVTYKPKNANIKFALGYGHITSGVYGDSNDTKTESRIYQEIVLPQKIGRRVYLKHRFRYEQRFIENQDFRTRYRYNLFLTIPLNKKEMDKGTVYLSLYNEIFLNGERNIGDDNTVEIFAVNRTYGAFGYVLSKKMKMQLGYMEQTTNNLSKGQVQLSLHHKF
ncbi:MAG: DUF2490 domain-containing protein [Flavobacteriaceae bacterium]|nr:DUF2490 domain-containing protein [Flavobacteriaceae bacterium]